MRDHAIDPPIDPPVAQTAPPLSILIVSYNTRALTLACLQSVLDHTATPVQIIVIDNASSDGSAAAIRAQFPQIDVIEATENLGFACANNRAAQVARGEHLLLLNPDTLLRPGAIDAALRVAKAQPKAGIVGGRSLFPDGRLNPGSCWGRITPWSLFCSAIGLTALAPRSRLFNPEGMGAWRRDRDQMVDIVQGSFLLISRGLWDDLQGFDEAYFMYGEEADLCHRARALGYRPMITPAAEYVHYAGASSPKAAAKRIMVAQGRVTLIRDHWVPTLVPVGLALMWLWAALRRGASALLALIWPQYHPKAQTWAEVWTARRTWLHGYRSSPHRAGL
ncbi:glycosyltransferase family 2 protein [Pseudooceanicola sp. MF1-13]|uniref:glycosyltransferase family 2 protein n=1 Tax=Pseudooceanicola sp. MF1-13 TaxID=3379095 RepID=UPI0038917079